MEVLTAGGLLYSNSSREPSLAGVLSFQITSVECLGDVGTKRHLRREVCAVSRHSESVYSRGPRICYSPASGPHIREEISTTP